MCENSVPQPRLNCHVQGTIRIKLYIGNWMAWQNSRSIQRYDLIIILLLFLSCPFSRSVHCSISQGQCDLLKNQAISEGTPTSKPAEIDSHTVESSATSNIVHANPIRNPHWQQHIWRINSWILHRSLQNERHLQSLQNESYSPKVCSNVHSGYVVEACMVTMMQETLLPHVDAPNPNQGIESCWNLVLSRCHSPFFLRASERQSKRVGRSMSLCHTDTSTPRWQTNL